MAKENGPTYEKLRGAVLEVQALRVAAPIGSLDHELRCAGERMLRDALEHTPEHRLEQLKFRHRQGGYGVVADVLSAEPLRIA